MRSGNVWTGERLETYIYNDNTIEHLHRYAISIPLIKNKVVLDIACGEGYGSNLLAEEAHFVYGVDISKETISNAQAKYVRSNLDFKHGTTSAIPLDDNSVDVVISFETIEHHDEHESMMIEIKRVTKPGGLLIISSPDKRTYTDLPKVVNPHHVKELYLGEFKSLVEKYFLNSSFYFQKMIHGSIVYQERNKSFYKEYTGSYSHVEKVIDTNHIYVICVASDDVPPQLNLSIFTSDEILASSTLNNQLETEHVIAKVKSSWSYKIGNTILKPFSLLKRILNA
ncbi:MAG: class I SAM-dependent methyltransferase [Pedobacter sp.]|nr:MAG: class I SAM-dependent methyltransferase [Pedobacter sp.]